MIKNLIKNSIGKLRKESELKKLVEDNFFNPYNNLVQYKDIKVNKIEKDYDKCSLKYTIISPVKNEENSIKEFLKSIEDQKLKPEQVIIIDGGSIDRTMEIVNDYASNSILDIKLIQISSHSISEQRNLGIKHSKTEYIVLADAGNILDCNYAINLMGCFEEYEDVDLVGAIYYAQNPKCEKYFIYDWESFNEWKEFLPAGKTMAIKKSIAESIGGFPEYLSYAGEDALFDIMYRNKSKHWMFNTKAFVHWEIPNTIQDTIKKFRAYGVGLGQNYMGDFRFYENYSKLKRGEVEISGVLVVDALFQGYLKGRNDRGQIEFEKRLVNNVYVIFSDKQIWEEDNIEEANKLSTDNNKVIFISRNTTYRNAKYENIDYSRIELYDYQDFTIEDLLNRYGCYSEKIIVLVKKGYQKKYSECKIVENLKKYQISNTIHN